MVLPLLIYLDELIRLRIEDDAGNCGCFNVEPGDFGVWRPSHHCLIERYDFCCAVCREPKLHSGKTSVLIGLKQQKAGWDGRIRTYGTLYQKQLPYHLATSQRETWHTAKAGMVQDPICTNLYSCNPSSRSRSSVLSVSRSAVTIRSSASSSRASTGSTRVLSRGGIDGPDVSRVKVTA